MNIEGWTRGRSGGFRKVRKHDRPFSQVQRSRRCRLLSQSSPGAGVRRATSVSRSLGWNDLSALRQQARTERISAGPATGRDGIYVFSTPPDIEAELLRPAVRGRDIDKYKIADPDLTIALPYSFDEQGRGSLIDLRRFPRLRRHLESHRVSLEARHCVRVWEKAWYDLHDQAAIDLARREKILVPDVAEGNRFAVDGGRFLPLHSAYYLLPRGGENLFYLVGVLNSSVCEFLIRLLAPRVKDGFSRYRRQFLATLPIPVPSLSEIRKIADAAKVGNETRVDELVYSLFRLTPSDQRRIARYLETDRLSGKRPPATGAEA